MFRRWFVLVGCLLLTLSTVAAVGGEQLEAQDEPDGEPAFGLAAPTACPALPFTATVRGKDVEFDQCFERTFDYDGTEYTIHVFYTEQDSTTNLNQCDASDGAGRCEHKISDNDNADGDNINAVLMAAEAETALTFYFDRNIDTISSTTMNVLIAEDPRSGGVIWPDTIYVDDERVDNNDTLQKRVLAFHEAMHLIQDKYDSAGLSWNSFYGEGISRAIEDRVDVGLDADTGHWFIPEVDGFLGNNSAQTDDIATISYRSVLWWTWLMDQYRAPSDTEPDLGWAALRRFYLELDTETDQVKAVNDFIVGEGGSFRNDFIDYTLSLYAYDLSPADSRLTYVDDEIRNNTSGLRNHVVIGSGPAFSSVELAMNPRSSRYIEFDPANQCEFIGFTFDGNGKPYGFSVMTADGGILQDRWTSYSDGWARTVGTANLDSVVGVITAFDQSGDVDVERGCVEPTINIKSPTTAAFEMIGTADDPRNFIVRVDVDGEDGSGVAGLTADAFTVELEKVGGGPTLTGNIINATYVQDDYWLLVSPPTDVDGAETGQFYDVTVTLGSQTDTESSSILYVKRTQDVVIVLDRSGSMSFASGKMAAARNAAALLVNELADDDQVAYVAFDTTADLQEQLDAAGFGAGSHRENVEDAIGNEVPLNTTAVGLGMTTAADEHDARGIVENMCSFILLSDGYENVTPFWADVEAQVADNGCAIHTIALGPEANELLMQQISAAVPGGSFDYADVAGDVPIFDTNGVSAVTAGMLGWENNLSRIYDAKAIQIAGRQRLQTAQDIGSRDTPVKGYEFYVDETATELVIAVAWQSPTKGEQVIQLIDPDGNMVTPDYQRFSLSNRNEVQKVNKPMAGFWKVEVSGLIGQEYFVSASSTSDYELYLFTGTPISDLKQGAVVPLLATFVGPGEPITGANVTATVRNPNGQLETIVLLDDGNHGDGEPNDGIYGGEYRATAASDAIVPKSVVENEEPSQVGSYLVNVVGVRGDLRREAQGSFAIETDRDDNQNGLPDGWETFYGVSDPEGDDDRDKLLNLCEFQNGTNPLNPDTDGGGESDGSEVPFCDPVRNPLDPDDDRVGKILSLTIRPEVFDLIPVIVLNWGDPLVGKLRSVNIYRRAPGGGPESWELVGADVVGNEYVDSEVETDQLYEYLLEPTIDGTEGTATGTTVASIAVMAKNDPYAPSGSILINNGDESTTARVVTLDITADDLVGEGDGDPADVAVPGSLTADLEMRISNSPNFEGVEWQPFQAEVTGWDLGDVRGGETAVVYVQFRDEAGNVGETGFAQSDSILFEQEAIYLPLVIFDS